MADKVELTDNDRHVLGKLSRNYSAVAKMLVENAHLREVDEAAHAYVRAGLCGNPDASAELHELIRVARRDF